MGGSVLLSMEHGHKRIVASGRLAQAGVLWPGALYGSSRSLPLYFPGGAPGTPFFDIAGVSPSAECFAHWCGLYVRLRILESPLFAKVQEEKKKRRLHS